MERMTLLTSKLYLRALQGLRRDEGQTMAEYALILVAVALVAVVGFKVLGNALNTKASKIGSSIATGTP
jgi:Flp pilus assembly pilin Flp